MNKNSWRLATIAGLFGLLLTAAKPAHASRMVDELIGTVTSAPVGNRIVVDGVAYDVLPSTRLNNKLDSLKKGDQVELLMNGSPFDKNAKVIDFILLSKQGE